MEVIIQPSVAEGSRLAALIVQRLIRKKPDATLGLATGSSPLGLYNELIRLHLEAGLDFSKVATFNLDEYVGLGPEHPASFHRFMHERLFNRINLSPERVHIPDGLASDIPEACGAYEAAIRRAGGIDLQILGLGHDGHIGFNEPGSSLASRTRIKTLAEETLAANARYFPSPSSMPRHAITMGVGTIMEARACLLLAFGRSKAGAVAQMAEGAVSASCPATILQMHPCATTILDEEAASQLKRASYYRQVYENKPEFQRIG